MSLISDIRKLKGDDITMGILGFLGVVAPGFLTIYHFHPELIEKYDALKIIIFSASLTVPVLFLNSMIVVISSPGKLSHRDSLIQSALGTVIVLYGALFWAYVVKRSFFSMLCYVAFAELAYLIFVRHVERAELNKSSKAEEPTN